MMTATRWWSESKQAWVVLQDMHDKHLMAANAKLERGEYRMPDDPERPGEDMRAPSAGETQHLLAAFASEFARRAIGPADEGMA